MQKITTFLWFDDQAEEAAEFYTSIFKDSEVLSISRLGADEPGTTGTASIVSFRITDQEFMALNGGPMFKFTEAISLFVNCENQAEVDELWEKLSNGGEPGQCGWLKDRYGLCWQIVPSELGRLMSDPDPEKSERVRQAMLQMGKIDIPTLRRVYAQE